MKFREAKCCRSCSCARSQSSRAALGGHHASGLDPKFRLEPKRFISLCQKVPEAKGLVPRGTEVLGGADVDTTTRSAARLDLSFD
jgi:hypothetical protein